jgi:hypothetical protein
MARMPPAPGMFWMTTCGLPGMLLAKYGANALA